MSRLVLRIWLPDRPGALGAVASRIGAVRGDVVGIDVIERDGGVAIDELVVDLPADNLVDLMLSEVRQVDGVGVEEVHWDSRAPVDPAASAFAAALRLLSAPSPSALGQLLVDEARFCTGAEWACLLSTSTPWALLASSGLTPHPPWLAAFRDGAVPARPGGGPPGPLDPVIMPVPEIGGDLLLSRPSRALRGRERSWVQGLAALAGRRWAELAFDAARRCHPSASQKPQAISL